MNTGSQLECECLCLRECQSESESSSGNISADEDRHEAMGIIILMDGILSSEIRAR